MKTSLLILAAIAAPALASDTWVNFIRQNQIKSGVVWDMPVDAQGSAGSALALEEEGALFQLWSIRQDDLKDFLIDQQVVGTYLPSAEIEIETGDPYPHVHRTRADQPFTVKITVSGLLGGAGVPDSATKVLTEHHLYSYSEEQTSVDPRIATGDTPASSGYLTANGTTELNFVSSTLPSDDPTMANGEEHFVVHSLPDQDAGQTEIASNFVQVWPVASASILGMNPGQEVRLRAPQLEIHLRDLYPSSSTYLQVYQGSARLGVDGQKMDGSILVLDQDTSENRIIPLRDWLDDIETEGKHTMEIVTETPFGPERLTYLSFVINRTMTVNSQIGDFEATP